MDQSPLPEKKQLTQMGPIFPTEVINEILSWLPVKSLTQCQLVCKDWQSLFRNKYFTQAHLDRSNAAYYGQYVTGQSNGQNLNSPGFSYWQGCNGLLLMKDKAENKYCLWNPATHRVLELPDPHVSSIALAFSFVPTSGSYRIVSLYKDRKELGCQVLTPDCLQADGNVWRQLDFPYPSSLKDRRRERVSMIASAGVVHFVLVTSVGQCINMDVVSLELETDNFFVCRLPILLGESSGWKNYWEMDWDGKLVIVDIVGENMEVMKLEDYKKGRWCEQKKIIHLPFLKKNGDENIPTVIPLFAEKGEIWLWLKDVNILKYTMGTGKCNEIMKTPSLFLSPKILPYRPSLVSFEGMVPDTKMEILRPHFQSS